MKVQTKYICQACGYESPRWIGKCPNCSQWNTFQEEVAQKVSARKTVKQTQLQAVPLDEIIIDEGQRIQTTNSEFDRVLGGGIVLGSVILLGGDPGVGKSTLMMQLAGQLQNYVVLYISGEESAKQIKLRAERLGMKGQKKLLLFTETNIDVINEVIEQSPPDILIVDSIQTMYRPMFESTPGTLGQIRECTSAFVKIAKTKSIPVFLIGHVTKEGVIAGPKVIEHMVDTVLQFEGERHYSYRILRALKNRFGSTNEIGVFEMRESGLTEVPNPSEVFLSERASGTSGSTVVASIEGTRPILVEVQALVTPTSYGTPQRNATGIDLRRLALLIAVLEKRVGVLLGGSDVFVNIAGGLRIDEPAIDLGVAVSIVSSLRDKTIDSQSAVVGEIGLSGEVRTVSQMEKRIQEAEKLGFKKIVVPQNGLKGVLKNLEIEIIGVERVEEAVNVLLK